MPDCEELVKVLVDLCKDAQEYAYQVNILKYDNRFIELETNKGRKNFGQIIRRLQLVNIPNPEETLKKSIDLTDFKNYLEEVLKIILGNEYEEEIKHTKDIIKPVYYSQNTDVRTAFENIDGINKPKEFLISEEHNPFQLVQVINAEVYALMEKLYDNFPRTFGNLNYQKIPGTIAMYIGLYELSKILKKENLLADFADYCTYHSSTYAKNDINEIIQFLPIQARKIVKERTRQSNYSFLLADIYSTYLLEKYLDDEKSFLEEYRKILDGETSIPNYLKYYNLNIISREIPQKYLDKIENVEKRYKLK